MARPRLLSVHLALAVLTSDALIPAFCSRADEVPAKPAALAGAWGDQGDGTFVNSILPGDFCDVDAIRVGDDYYAITSTMHLSPGMTVLHSRDLVNWRIIGHAIDDITAISPEMNWDRMNRYGRGVWAGAIRYHDGKYWIYFGAPDDGIFMTTATDPAGPWAPLHCVWKVSGWNDTCPFWDDDGQGYLVTTNFATDPGNGKAYNVHLFEMTDDGKSLRHETDAIIHQSRGSEANKLDKVGDTYYHFYSEVHGEGRVVMMNRAKSLSGPWETKQLNHVRKGVDNEPNQGGIVQTRSGEWWFVTHQGTGAWEGRSLALLPVTWQEGWPILGAVGDDGIGTMVWSAPKPVIGETPPTSAEPLMPLTPLMPEMSDEFGAPALAVQWQWNHQPRAGMWSLEERPGYLRLRAFPPRRQGDFRTAGNTLSQRTYRTPANQVTVKLDLSGMADGQVAGLCHFSKDYALIGASQTGDKRSLVSIHSGERTEGPSIDGDQLWLQSDWDETGTCRFAYSVDGAAFTPLGPAYTARFGHYRGDRIGVFTWNDEGEAGHIDVDWLHHDISNQRGRPSGRPGGQSSSAGSGDAGG